MLIENPKARIHIHGPVGEKFGRVWELGVGTPGEAVYAISRLKPGFAEAIRASEWRVVYGDQHEGTALDESELGLQFGTVRELHLIPMAAGSKSGGLAKVVLGVALIAASVAFPETVGAAGTWLFGASAGADALSVGLFGGMMILAGISSMLTHQTATPTGTDQRQGFGMSGQVNTMRVGVPIPLAYGRIRVGSVVTSLSYTVADIGADTGSGSGKTGLLK